MKKQFLIISILSIGAVFLVLLMWTNEKKLANNFVLMGTNFNNTLPIQSTCQGTELSPGLSWSGAPEGTKSYALTMHQDLGNGNEKICMVQYHIDGGIRNLERGDQRTGTWGTNTINDLNTYAAPCPLGKDEEYTITLYALSKAPNIRPSNSTVTKGELELALAQITLATAVKRVVATTNAVVYSGV